MKFSVRNDFEKNKEIQSESMDANLRNSLWNLHEELFESICSPRYPEPEYRLLNIFLEAYWKSFFKLPIHLLSLASYPYQRIVQVRESFYSLKWYNVYSFVEFTASYMNSYINSKIHNFRENCNSILEAENSAFRFIGEVIAPITSNIEIEEVEIALALKDKAAQHIESAIALLTNREKNQYRECCHEAISAVEAMARQITGEKKATLGMLCKKLNLSTALAKALSAIYGYSSDEGGVRHSLTDDSIEIKCEDARYFLIMCAAFVNLIKAKNSEPAKI